MTDTQKEGGRVYPYGGRRHAPWLLWKKSAVLCWSFGNRFRIYIYILYSVDAAPFQESDRRCTRTQTTVCARPLRLTVTRVPRRRRGSVEPWSVPRGRVASFPVSNLSRFTRLRVSPSIVAFYSFDILLRSISLHRRWCTPPRNSG